jgi:hypothetical protein
MSSFIFALLVWMIALSPSCAEQGERGCCSGLASLLVVYCLILFAFLWLIAWGIRRRRVWAWFMALLVFAVYVLLGLAGFSGGRDNGWLLVPLPFGIVGIGALFTRDCRKEFGIN